jgi:pilus assembly protein CpaB
MKNQSTILLVVAVGCGLVAMLGVRQAINKKDSNQEEMVDVLSASVDIPAGVPLNETNVRFVPMAVSSVPEGAVTSMEEITERGLKVPAMNGDWILKSKLGEKGQFGAIIRIPPGMAAATIPVDATTAHSGMLKAGNRIDLLLTYAETGPTGTHQKTIAVLEFVEVFAVDNRIYGTDKEGEGSAKNISLLVTPEQAKAVTLASNIGKLSTIMRKPGDRADEKGSGEISQEFLTSSFMGSNLDAPSVASAEEEHLPVPKQEENKDVAALLDDELNRTAEQDPGGSVRLAIADARPTWTMEIYEGDKVRLESVELPSDSSATGDWNIWGLWNQKK